MVMFEITIRTSLKDACESIEHSAQCDWPSGGVEDFDKEMARGMDVTLGRLKAVVEGR